MTYQGYIKLFRKIQDNPLYKEKRRFNRGEAWVDLLLMANHKQNEIIVDFNRVPVKRGEVFTSQLKLSKKWNWGIASVNRFLKLLNRENQISYKAESKYTIISILNWDKYQGEAESSRKAKRKPERKPLGNHSETNKNDKNEKNISSSKGRTISFKKEDYSLVLQAYQRLKGIALQGEEFRPIERAIKSMFISRRSPEQIISCMEWFASLKEDWAKNWTIGTVQKKMPEFVAGKFTKDDSWKYGN